MGKHHQWKDDNVQPFSDRTCQSCDCGARSQKMNNGFRNYINQEGKSIKSTNVPEHFMKPMCTIEILKPIILDQQNAIAKDCIVIFKVVYSEMIKAGMRTAGMNMMRGMLESKGYAEVVNYLNGK